MIVYIIINTIFYTHCPCGFSGYFLRQEEKTRKTPPMEDAMVGYESLAWIKDKNGKEYVCPIEALKGDTRDRFELNEEERRECMDVNLIIGTERW